MWNPLSWVMEAAAVMAIALANGGGKPPDWQDFVGIIVLLVINSTISFVEENNAGNAAAALMARLAPKAKILRDGHWNEDDASILVPGDVISVKLGDIIPADARLLNGDPLKIDQILRDGHWNEDDASILVPGDVISVKLGDIIPADARLLNGDPLKIDQILRDGHWNEDDASILVPGDVISVKLGDIIPADARLLNGDPLKIDQILRDGHWNEDDASILVPGDVISVKLGDIIPADARLLNGDPLKIDQILRDGHWNEDDASILVPGDVISVKLGDIIPADARLLNGDPLKIDQILRDGHWNEDDASILVPGDVISVKLGDIIPADARLLNGDPLKIDQILRDGHWNEDDASILVPGDVISVKLGDIIPADARLLNGDPLKIDQSSLTGESLPVTKGPGDGVYSGSTCKQGEIEAVVIATGVHTFFGKAAHLVDTTNQVGHFQKVLTAIGNFCICSIAVGMIIEIVVMFPIQDRKYRPGIDNLLVLLIGGIPIAMQTVLSVTMAIGSHRLAQQGAITKRITAIEEMAGMDVLCSDKTGTSTLNKLTVDKNLIEVFAKGVDADTVVLMSARASRTENQDAIDAAIVGMLADPKEARARIQEVHFLPFNPTDKRTALTYLDNEGKMHRVSKGAPEQILDLAHNKSDIVRRVHAIIGRFADRGLRSLAVAYQDVPEGRKESPGGPWQFVGLMPLFDPPRHDSAETIRRALDLGVNVKMITGDQLAIGKETGRRLGMGTNMYPSSALLGQNADESIAALPIDELIEKADGFAGVFPEHKYEIVIRLQARNHICGMTGDGVNDAPALKRADIGIAVAEATDAARGASDIVLTEPGLSVIISAVLTSRAIFQRMKNYTIYAVSITIRIVLGFMLLALIWKFDFPPFMVLIIAILNDGTIMTISKDRVKPSPLPDSWKLAEIFTTCVILGSYLAMMTVIFFWAAYKTDFFPRTFGVPTLEKTVHDDFRKLASAVYLQVSTISQALIFVTRSRSWSFVERPGWLLVVAFAVAQLIATLIAVYANWSFAAVEGIGWGWAGIIWLYNIIFYFPLDLIKLFIRYTLSGRARDLVIERRIAFTRQKDFGKEQRELQWAHAQRTLHGLEVPDTKLFGDRTNVTELNNMAEEAKRRAEMAKLRELHTLKGHVESVVRMKGIDIETIQQAYTV